jgi:hypothetical protein
MSNEHGQELKYIVYEVVGNGHVGDHHRFYGFVQVQSFDEHNAAEIWINEEGERHVNYTIIEVLRNK